MTSFWSIWVSVIILGSIFGCLWLVYVTRKSQRFDSTTEETMGHTFDGIEEYDNPMPKWWLWLFIGTCIYALGYLVVYPGLGNYKGVFGWSSTGHWEQEVAEANEKHAPMFSGFAAKPIPELAKDVEAMKVGQRLFANNCAVCHGSAGKGALGFPDLTDNDWLYGGEPDTIKQTILHGRNGQMPVKGLNPAMSADDVNDLTHFLLSFSQRSDDPKAAERGKSMFATACAACHGADAKGMQAAGAPNLTDNIWLYGSTPAKINQTITYGRAGVMPAQKDKLGEDKVHLLAAYVYSLSHP
jgi:cytochrome c oxidase cbb3-type subunit III